jgi:hypothetical protein
MGGCQQISALNRKRRSLVIIILAKEEPYCLAYHRIPSGGGCGYGTSTKRIVKK